MGGVNQSTCPPVSKKTSESGKPVSGNQIRYHESSDDDEYHFHDDSAGIKCAIDVDTFDTAYGEWLDSYDEEFTIDGCNNSSVHFQRYSDSHDNVQIAITVNKGCNRTAKLGQSFKDLHAMIGI